MIHGLLQHGCLRVELDGEPLAKKMVRKIGAVRQRAAIAGLFARVPESQTHTIAEGSSNLPIRKCGRQRRVILEWLGLERGKPGLQHGFMGAVFHHTNRLTGQRERGSPFNRKLAPL